MTKLEQYLRRSRVKLDEKGPARDRFIRRVLELADNATVNAAEPTPAKVETPPPQPSAKKPDLSDRVMKWPGAAATIPGLDAKRGAVVATPAMSAEVDRQFSHGKPKAKPSSSESEGKR